MLFVGKNPLHMNGKKIHIIGIGGTGMNGVAQLAAHAGYSVSGSDRATDLPIFQALEQLGIRIVPQDGSGIAKETDFVVYSTAIETSNPDIQQSNLLGIPLLHRADMLAKLCAGKEVIAVAGTAGKSTVTGLLGWIFQCLGKDPTVYCGAPVLNWQRRGGVPTALQRGEDTASTVGNVRYGSGPWIIEADESDRSFLKFHPNHAIITNISEDHFSLAELHKLFAQFESQVSGIVIQGSQDGCDTVPQASSPALLGKHNVENVNNALTLCKALGLDMPKCIEAVATFKGIERRLERHGSKVIDDFAHSPVKIAAALEAVAEEFPAFSAYWRPHGYTPLSQGLDGFIEVFANHWELRPADRLFILPVYFAGGTVNIKITSEQFVKRLQAVGVPAEFVPNYDALEKRLLADANKYGGTAASPSSGIEADAPPKAAFGILGMGARDPELPLFARRLATKLK